jgi:hypothetical protein
MADRIRQVLYHGGWCGRSVGCSSLHILISTAQTESSMGMIPRAVDQVFRVAEELRPKGWEYKMEGQFLEIVSFPRDAVVLRTDVTCSTTKRSTTSSETLSSTRKSTRSSTMPKALVSPTRPCFLSGLLCKSALFSLSLNLGVPSRRRS